MYILLCKSICTWNRCLCCCFFTFFSLVILTDGPKCQDNKHQQIKWRCDPPHNSIESYAHKISIIFSALNLCFFFISIHLKLIVQANCQSSCPFVGQFKWDHQLLHYTSWDLIREWNRFANYENELTSSAYNKMEWWRGRKTKQKQNETNLNE